MHASDIQSASIPTLPPDCGFEDRMDILDKILSVRKSRKVTTAVLHRFLLALQLFGTIGKASQYAKISEDRIYALKRQNTLFKEQVDKALDIYRNDLQDGIRTAIAKRAIDGIDEPVFQGGKLVGYVKKYSDSLLAQMAKANLPEYQERIKVETETTTNFELPPAIRDFLSALAHRIEPQQTSLLSERVPLIDATPATDAMDANTATDVQSATAIVVEKKKRPRFKPLAKRRNRAPKKAVPVAD